MGTRRMLTRRFTTGLAALAIASTTLLTAGCAADWDVPPQLATEECVATQGLFTSPGTNAPTPGVEVPDEQELARKLSASLGPHLPQQHQAAGKVIATVPTVDSKPAELERYQAALQELQLWAAQTCGPDIAGVAGVAADTKVEDLPQLAEVYVAESREGDTRSVSVAGARSPQHALALCKQAQRKDPQASQATFLVSDPDGLILAFAEVGQQCEYNPALFED